MLSSIARLADECCVLDLSCGAIPHKAASHYAVLFKDLIVIQALHPLFLSEWVAAIEPDAVLDAFRSCWWLIGCHLIRATAGRDLRLPELLGTPISAVDLCTIELVLVDGFVLIDLCCAQSSPFFTLRPVRSWYQVRALVPLAHCDCPPCLICLEHVLTWW